MIRDEIIAKVKEFAETICESIGIELIHVEYQRETGGSVVRLYVDKQGGVTLNDCTLVSRQLIDMLDINLNTDIPYSLEVSSPGVNRPLGKPEDFEKFKGNTAKIRTSVPLEGQKNFKGVLLGFNDGFVGLNINDKMVAIPYKEITKARLFNYNGENRC
ncbi:MAG: ribosome maturation factor RimP [Proteobacteria bacterium]|nr:ribosome maturation factor RimP [Pseudomonadota bacterium]MBU4037095.1 ribosome maturation factor RimP [Pseudomonadota bacterium]